jgi:hypothetical protein
MSYLVGALTGIVFISTIALVVFPHIQQSDKIPYAAPPAKTDFFNKYYQQMLEYSKESNELFLQQELTANNFNVDTSDASDLGDGYIPIMTLDYYGTWYAVSQDKVR